MYANSSWPEAARADVTFLHVRISIRQILFDHKVFVRSLRIKLVQDASSRK